MSLATRCSACGTVFRVVQDQLKVSEGWVRCGRCNEVFNALEGLFDLDRETPPEWAPEDREEWARQGTPPVSETGAEDTEASEARDPQLVDKIDSELFGQRKASPVAATEVDAPIGPGLALQDDEAPPAHRFPIEHDGVTSSDDEAPDFLRKAERAERWQRPWVRAVLSVAALGLLGTLGVQAVHHFRDDVAARWPEAAPLLEAWCSAAACSLGAPRHIDDVAVESTALSRAGSAEAYRLNVVLRNHGGVAVAMPAVDLALTDANGQLIARRTLSVRDFVSAPTRLPAGGDANLQTTLSAGATKITGYTVEVFYP